MNDLISRQDAIDELVRWGKLPDYNEGERNVIACVIGMLCSLPSAQPERKAGEWFVDIYKYGKDRYECSECCKTTDVGYDFCPYCGADMRGNKGEE